MRVTLSAPAAASPQRILSVIERACRSATVQAPRLATAVRRADGATGGVPQCVPKASPLQPSTRATTYPTEKGGGLLLRL